MKAISLLTTLALSLTMIACDNNNSTSKQNSVTTKKNKTSKTDKPVKIASQQQPKCLYEGDDITAQKTGLKDTDEIIFTWKSLTSEAPSKNTSYTLKYYIDWDATNAKDLQKEVLGETVAALLGRESSKRKVDLSVGLTGKEVNDYLKKSKPLLKEDAKLFLSFDLIKNVNGEKTIAADMWASLETLKNSDKKTDLQLRSATASADISLITKRDCKTEAL